MIKKILFGLILIFIAVIALIWFYGSEKLNSLIKQGIETVGPQVTQSPVTLDSVNLSIFSGSGSIKNLLVGNPEGFETEGIFSLGEIQLELEPKSVFSDTIVINRIYIQQPAVTYERTLKTSNLKELKKNIEAFTGPQTASTEPAAAEEASAEPAKKIVIRELIIEEGSITVSGMGYTKKAVLPRIELSGIGEDGNRQPIGQILDMIVAEVTKAVGPALAEAGIDGVLNEALEKVGGESSENLKKTVDQVKGLFGK